MPPFFSCVTGTNCPNKLTVWPAPANGEQANGEQTNGEPANGEDVPSHTF
jgi:hypothetical protein